MTTAAEPRPVFGTSSGFKEKFDFAVNEAYFATDSNYNKGKTIQLILIGIDEETGEEVTVKYNVGSTESKDGKKTLWQSPDQGRTVKNYDAPNNNPDKKSALGELVTAIQTGKYPRNKLNKDGVVFENSEELLKFFIDEGGPGKDLRHADNWVGHRFYMDNHEFDYGINKETKEPIITDRLVPIKYIGRVEGGGGPKFTDEQMTELKAAALEAGSKAKFQSMAVNLVNDKLFDVVMGDGFYEGLIA